jgi:hypothetical protein
MAESEARSYAEGDDPKSKIESSDPRKNDVEHEIFRQAEHDAAAIPEGTIDPVYEAKARVLNHAVN